MLRAAIAPILGFALLVSGSQAALAEDGDGVPTEPFQIASEVHGSLHWNLQGLRGKGIKVGVIDTAFTGFGELMGTELPSSVQMLCYVPDGPPSQKLSDCESPFNMHGTTVAEAIIDIAPDLSLYISNMWDGSDLTEAVNWMIAEGVSVINVSFSFEWDGPGDGTSPLYDSPLNNVDSDLPPVIVPE